MRITQRMQVYGAWLYRVPAGSESPQGGCPGDGWTLLRMRAGRFTTAPSGMAPKAGQVLLLGQGEKMLKVTPRKGER